MIHFLNFHHKKLIFLTIFFWSSLIFSMENHQSFIKSLSQLCAETLADELTKKLQKSADKLEFISKHNLLLDSPELLPEHLDKLIGQELINKHPQILKRFKEQLPFVQKKLPTDFLHGSTFSGNGARLAILDMNNIIRIIDPKTTMIITSIKEDHDKLLSHFYLNENGTLIATQFYATKGHQCNIRDVDTGQLKKQFNYEYINKITFDHKGIHCAIAFDDTKIALNNLNNPDSIRNLEILCPETYPAQINSLCFTHNSKFIAATRKHLFIFDLTALDKQPIQIKTDGKNPILSSNGSFYSHIMIENKFIFSIPRFVITSMDNQRESFVIPYLFASSIYDRLFSKDGSFVAIEDNNTDSFKIWDQLHPTSFNGKKIDRIHHTSVNHDGSQLCGKTKHGPVLFDTNVNFDSLYNSLTIRKALLLISLYDVKQFSSEQFLRMVTNKKGRSIIKKLYRSFSPTVQEELLKEVQRKIKLKQGVEISKYSQLSNWIKNIFQI
ncbi:MAG: hypothetical protein BWY54_00469 [Candidatus Dependentiae bacterium ADurb.Bin331]|nr:MAG: hypothetical protein BWY54_00469 [Candidatus Dependentiae bacterium ADurb.Bin331]